LEVLLTALKFRTGKTMFFEWCTEEFHLKFFLINYMVENLWEDTSKAGYVTVTDHKA
jgi:hypothetical protein